jgi:pimeloyl-ACP methyl ester carboxylesterase/lysophospholipase L1-like esterase
MKMKLVNISRRLVFFVTIVLLALIASPAHAQTQTVPLPGEPTDWKGYAKHDFEVDDRKCYVVAPKFAAPGNPWVWRARFPGFHAEADLILLERGFHIAHMNSNGMLGSDAALDHWDAFYEKLTTEHGLAKRVALEGVSRGGLFVYRWAARHPKRVACIYADTPVCDFKSWPGGRGEGLGHVGTWQSLLKAYGLTEDEALAWKKNPIDVLEPIAKAKVPILHIVSLNDKVVPPKENTFVLADRYRELSGSIDIIEVQEGTAQSNGHHFDHPDPVRVADFIERHASVTPDSADYFTLRGSLDNCRIKFERDKKGKVVFVGGSITVMENGWRQMTCDYLQQKFPDTEFTFVNAGISSTGSPFAAFRLMKDAFAGGAPDLLFEEAAVNDLHIGQSDTHIKRGMEGVLRRMRETSPKTDVVLMHFAEPRHSTDYRNGKTPTVIGIHEPIAKHYGVPTIHLAREVPERIDAGQFTWKDDFRNLHPSPFGHRLYASTIRRTLSAAWEKPLTERAAVVEHVLPEPIDKFCFSKGDYVAPDEMKGLKGFELMKNCDPRANGVGGRVRPGFHGVDMLVGDAPGDRFSHTFTGSAIGLVVAAGPDAGEVSYRIDDGAWQTLDIGTRHKGLHLPRLHVLFDELDPKKEHTLTVKLNPSDKPTACRIVYLAVNGE